ncbi:MAG: 4Fe-4S dicluster domain-containing protein [Phycisphaerales bacterium JB039]
MSASRRATRSPREHSPSRRTFVKLLGAAAATVAIPEAAASERRTLDEDRLGVLADLTLCIGCRRCEWACAEARGAPHGPLHEYDDASVFEQTRRPTPDQLTVVNRVGAGPDDPGVVHLKIQCMHCEKPACVSACLVGAMQKQPDGPVTYDASRCIGCRYCMVACPFERLTYEYDKPLTPRVGKCDMCRARTREGRTPACVEMCPVEALTFGPRAELLKIAHQRIADNPDRYVDQVYGETEAGGTSWLYIADRPFSQLGFPALGPTSPAAVTEAIQHGIFWGFAAPIGLFAALGAVNFATGRRKERAS